MGLFIGELVALMGDKFPLLESIVLSNFIFLLLLELHVSRLALISFEHVPGKHQEVKFPIILLFRPKEFDFMMKSDFF